MTLKSETINDAFSQLRISGLTVIASPANNATALRRLESMADELEGRNMCMGYNFEEVPDPNSQMGVARKFEYMFSTNLALRLAVDFGKAIPQSLSALASSSMSSASSAVAAKNIRQVQPSRRSPIGSGNHRNTRYRRFHHPDPLPPNQCATNELFIDNTQDYVEDFDVYLGEETISSYVITADSGLTIVSDSNTDTAVSYRITAADNSTQGIWQQVKIVITTSSGRVETRLIDFEISDSVTVGGV